MTNIDFRPSAHFTLAEAMRSQEAVRHGIDNLPPRNVFPALAAISENIFEPIRTHFGIPYTPQSWFRCEALERRLCWTSFINWCKRRTREPNEESWAIYFDRKQHPKGCAGDLELPGIPNYELAKWIRDNLEFDQLILEFHVWGKPSSGWVHASFVDGENRGEVLTIGRGKALPGLPDYDYAELALSAGLLAALTSQTSVTWE